ncbi:DUF2785 domain-containing protein [Sporosarcina gallistercoris]|uniref:DUF2785 domain-containing protein n=1 Tax=Sporosarcina gallistercoris TaxID=2762245 RepID=UPI003D2C5D90
MPTRYVRKEKDVRGSVDGKGWAHAMAHAADKLGEISKHRYIKEDELIELLEVLNVKVLFSNSIFTHNEDERMVLSAFITNDRGVLSEQNILSGLTF